MNQVAVDDRISTAATERFLVHTQQIDPPTLSPECHQPSHQNVITVSSATLTPREAIRHKGFRRFGGERRQPGLSSSDGRPRRSPDSR